MLISLPFSSKKLKLIEFERPILVSLLPLCPLGEFGIEKALVVKSLVVKRKIFLKFILKFIVF